MCGIAGFCDMSNNSSEAVLVKMTNSVRHRGPDDIGISFSNYHNTQVGLGHRRLSILDLSTCGHQPMRFERYEIIFNGEIYNFLEIRKELEKEGYSFRSHSDTEIILTGFHKWGIRVIDKFIGMFAFVLFDKSEHKLYLVRDRIGVKPLYYYYKNDLLLFASELKAFHEHPCFKKTLNQSSLSNYFQFGYSICPETIFEDTYQVRPGHYAVFDIGRKSFSENAYWRIEDYYSVKETFTETEVLNNIESLLISSANYRMVSDVPVGLFLSGGYDSSTLAAVLQKDRTEKIKTFTIGFNEKEFDEAPFAKKVARYLGTDHTEHYCSMNDAVALIPEMPVYFDEPYADHSSIPTMLVSELAHKKVTVALSADGGDELFGGYPKYLQALKYQKIKKLIPHPLSQPLKRAYDFTSGNILCNGKLAKYRTINNKISELIVGSSVVDFARINVQQFEEKVLNDLLVGGWKKSSNFFYDNLFFERFDNVDKLLLLDFKVFLPDDLLVKIDRATMRVSLEGREPLLDHRLIEFMGSVNAKSKINYSEQTTKYHLKKIAHKYLPEELLNRPKMGFTPPIATWFKGPLREYVDTYLNKSVIKSQDVLNYSIVEKVKRDFYDLNYSKASKKLWNILMFQMWFKKWMD